MPTTKPSLSGIYQAASAIAPKPPAVPTITPAGGWASGKLVVLALGSLSNGSLIGDWTNLAVDPIISTNEHGFESFGCFLPMPFVDAWRYYDQLAGKFVRVLAGGKIVIWEGRIEDRKPTVNGLVVGAFGQWRALSDTLYTAIWSDTSSQGWEQINDTLMATAVLQKFGLDNNNRLFFAPRVGESFSNGQGAYWGSNWLRQYQQHVHEQHVVPGS